MGIYGFLNGTIALATSGNYIVSSSEHNTFNYQVCELYLAKDWHASEYTNLKFKAGAKGAFIEESMRVIYIADTGSESGHHNSWNYKSGGIFAGRDARWKIWGGLDIFAAINAAGVYGPYSTFTYAKDKTLTSGLLNDMSTTDHRTIYTTNLLGGIGWQWSWKNFGMRLHAGYEMNTWFNLSQITKIPLIVNLRLMLQNI